MATKRRTAQRPGPRPDQDRRIRLGELLKAARGARGWTQRQVADALDKGTSAINDYEVGRREPPGLVLIDLFVLLGLKQVDLHGLARAA